MRYELLVFHVPLQHHYSSFEVEFHASYGHVLTTFSYFQFVSYSLNLLI
nr:MAG TPA: hypothetical protein [Caudoviricetes sp.]